jgi:hypothetical protein
LLDTNSLQDVMRTTQIAGVMVRGRWLPRSDLEAMLDGLKGSFRQSRPERLWPLGLVGAALLIFRKMF